MVCNIYETALLLNVILSFTSVVKTLEFVIYQNSYLDVEAFKFFSPLGIQMCVDECLMMEKCASINFERTHLLCKLNAISHMDASTTPTSGTLYGFINKENVPCRSCEEDETCIQVSSENSTCVKTECSTPRPEVTYSSYSRTFDPPSITFICDSGTTTLGTTPSSTCVPGEPWTSIDIICQPPIHGGWSTWSSYGSCPVTCGGGIKSRTRSCNNPSPQYGGAYCPGSPIYYASCNSQACPSCITGWSTRNDKCYLPVNSAATWSGALNSCGNLGTQASLSQIVHLAEPKDGSENSYLASIAYGNSWIGVSDTLNEGTWVYSSNEAIYIYANWNPSEPNGGTGESCAQLYTTTYWNDASCSSSIPYICEYTL